MGSLIASKPHVLVTSWVSYPHVEKMAFLAQGLHRLGYPVTFVSGEQYRKAIESKGIAFVAFDRDIGKDTTTSSGDVPDGPLFTALDFGLWALRGMFLRRVPEQFHFLQELLLEFRENTDAPVIIMHDYGFTGTMPWAYNVPGPRPDGIIKVAIAPYYLDSKHHGPFWSMVPPATSEEGRLRIQEAYKDRDNNPQAKKLENFAAEMFQSLGIADTKEFLPFYQAPYADRLLQWCIPEADYQRSDEPSQVRWIGAPRATGFNLKSRDLSLPSWWDEAVSDSKPIVVISPSSVSTDAEELVIPSLRALGELDCLIICTLVCLDPSSLEGMTLPPNVKVADFLPFDRLLPYTDVLICNGGWGTVQKALVYGVPMVLAGVTEDKAETNARMDWLGVGIDLRTGRPSEDQVYDATKKVLNESKYRLKAKQLSKRYEEYDTVGLVAKAVDEVAEERQSMGHKLSS